ncbi:uncharacterized protein LOC109494043 isoform X2 [Felis catus]|uniref:uncharacterized protein LOC109494043 isoform X2 n=1 Tax=Felis catus TaxID=9685 RepID=UPI001D1A2D00|nr:uncharacterized protein LOC109494043 isoform X2 [Felis catus]
MAMRVGLDHQKGVGAGRKPGSCSHPAAPPSLLAGQPTLGLSTTATCWDPCEPPAASPPCASHLAGGWAQATRGRCCCRRHSAQEAREQAGCSQGLKRDLGVWGGTRANHPRPKQEDRRALLTAGTHSGGHQDWRNAPRPPSLPPPTTAAPNPRLSREPAPATNTGTCPQPCLQGSAQGQTSSRRDLGPRRRRGSSCTEGQRSLQATGGLPRWPEVKPASSSAQGPGGGLTDADEDEGEPQATVGTPTGRQMMGKDLHTSPRGRGLSPAAWVSEQGKAQDKTQSTRAGTPSISLPAWDQGCVLRPGSK